ncbi:MAG: hypothetical protein L0H36_02245 [bacterium]|nr:hypothetical protein [bacterium]MDN5835436.1 hypothetical protein [bacterium]
MSYQGGEYIPERYDDNDSQAFNDIVSAEDLSSIVTPELEKLENLRQDFSQSLLDVVEYADSIKLRSSVKNINRFPELGEKHINKFNRYVAYMMKSSTETDPSVAANITAAMITESAQTLNDKSLGNADYLAPANEDIMAEIAKARNYDETNSKTVSNGATGVYAEYLGLNMSTYVRYIVQTRGLNGNHLRSAKPNRLSSFRGKISKLALDLAAGYLFTKHLNSKPETDDE